MEINMRNTIAVSLLLAMFYVYGGNSAVFTLKNNCKFQIWPAALTGTGSKVPTGFALPPNTQKDVTVLPPWSGRFWGRSECSSTGKFTCLTGDCASGQIECNGAGGVPPASLVEFTLAEADGKDFYDVSLVDGFNLPVSVAPVGGGSCPTASCPGNINRACPPELAVKGPNNAVVGCKSACLALNEPQYCCTGDFGTPDKCKPTKYSQLFKTQCPQAYSYAYDDKTSLLTCPTGANYVITFCP